MIRPVFATALALFSTPLAAATPEEAVLAPAQAFLAGIGSGDKATMLAQAMPDGSLTSMKDGKVRRMTIADLVAKLPPAGQGLEERMHDPLVRIDGDLAVVWGPYVFTIQGKPHHCGTDLFNLVHIDGRWTIASVADTEGPCAGQ
jgi:hypothetical protein